MFRILSFGGRSDRGTFFAVTALLYLFAFAAAGVLAVGVVNLDMDLPTKDVPAFAHSIHLPLAAAWAATVAGVAMVIYIIIATFAVSVRRLHDFGLTGFFVLLYFVLKGLVPEPDGWPYVVPGPADLIWDLIMIAQPGNRGPNAFGPAADAAPAPTDTTD